MPISYILPFKFMLISTTVLSAAIALKLSAPSVTDFAVYELPSIYNGVVSWLTPPYLYLVINFIIITIVASSKLQSRKDDEIITPAQLQSTVVKSIEPDYPVAEFNYNGVVLLNDSRSFDVEEEEKVLDFEDAGARVGNETTPFVAYKEVDVASNKENEFVFTKSTLNSVDKEDSTEYSPSNVKPPVSTRFVHRRNVRASPEGSRTVLGVSKPKKQDTLESTWKTITEGRGIPITRHLRKSDTWERDNHSHSRDHLLRQEKSPQKMMTKAETFNDRTNTRSPPPGTSTGSGNMKKEPSLSQDELTRRVEAFIKKFNEDMKLQRQESLNQYKEMINRGSH